MEKELLRPSELMKALKIKKNTYQRLVKDDMPCYRLGGGTSHRRYDLDKVLAWLDDRLESVNREDAE